MGGKRGERGKLSEGKHVLPTIFPGPDVPHPFLSFHFHFHFQHEYEFYQASSWLGQYAAIVISIGNVLNDISTSCFPLIIQCSAASGGLQ